GTADSCATRSIARPSSCQRTSTSTSCAGRTRSRTGPPCAAARSSTSRPASCASATTPRTSTSCSAISPLSSGLVESHRGANQRLEGPFVELAALVEVDRSPRVPAEAGVEQARRVRKRCALREGHLDDGLVDLARADQPVVRPHRNAPLPLLDDLGIGLLD